MAKSDLPALPSPGSRELKNPKYEKYCRLRASLQPRVQAYREVGWQTSDDDDAYSNACQLERRRAIRERIAFLSHQAEQQIAEKRRRIEEALWNIHDADVADLFETIEVPRSNKDSKLETDETGKTLTVRKQRPRLLSDLPPDLRKAIERVQVDARGNVVPQLYSRLQASAELRKMHGIGSQKDPSESDVTRLSDAELIQQLSDQAKELGVDINLNYSFAQQGPATETDSGPPVVDVEPDAAAGVPPVEAGDVAAAAELRIAADPGVTGARPVRAARA